MKTTLFMAVSADGFVARKDCKEDFLPDDGWMQMLEFAKGYGHIIWGSKTYKAVSSWGGNFMKDINAIPIIIVSRQNNLSYPANVTLCSSPAEAIKIAGRRRYKKAFLSGGPTLNTAFAKAELIDEIILNYNPIIISEGKSLFSDSDLEIKLKIEDIKELNSGIVQIRYLVR